MSLPIPFTSDKIPKNWKGRVMTKEHILDIALKVFGIYCVAATIKFLFFFGPLFIGKSEKFLEMYTSKVGFIISQIPYPLLHLFLAYVFLFRTPWLIRLVGGKDYDTSLLRDSQTSEWQTYSFWIKILGLYYFISSAAAIAASAIEFVFRNSGRFFIRWSNGTFLTDVFILLLSLFFIFKSGKVEDLIRKQKVISNQITQANRE
jgi:hypothetical protein